MIRWRGPGTAKARASWFTPSSGNRALDEWHSLFLDELMASAAMDRLLHHAHVVVIEGHTYRIPPSGRKVG